MVSKFTSPAADYVEKRICVSDVCGTDSPTVRIAVSDRPHGPGIFVGSLLVIDSAIKPVHGNIIAVLINSEFFIKRLSLYPRRGLVSLFDEKDFIALSDRYLEDTEVVVEGVVTWSINDTRADVFDDRPCM